MAIIEQPSPQGARCPGKTAQQIMADDAIVAPATLREESQLDLGTADIPVQRYVSREWHGLEVEHLWKKV